MNQLTQTCPQSATDELVDIREVAVDKDLPKEERIAAFLHQIKNRNFSELFLCILRRSF